MSVLIIFRNSALINRFHQLIIDSLNSGKGDEVIICSGFFQEDQLFSASMTTQLACSICQSNLKITTIGIHNGSWKKRYKKFRDNFLNCNININALFSKKYHWHAKIFILKKNGLPIFGIIGSSNLTRPAFGLSSPFNFEADVVLWDKNIKEINDICQAQTDLQEKGISDLIYADYNMERNGNVSSMRKLQEIENELFAQELIVLDE